MSQNPEREHSRHELVARFVLLEPWDYLPPRLPEEITQEIKDTWFKYVELWAQLRSPYGVEPDEDTLGELWSLYLELRGLGIWFDPLFVRLMDEIGSLAVNLDTDWEPKNHREERGAA